MTEMLTRDEETESRATPPATSMGRKTLTWPVAASAASTVATKSASVV